MLIGALLLYCILIDRKNHFYQENVILIMNDHIPAILFHHIFHALDTKAMELRIGLGSDREAVGKFDLLRAVIGDFNANISVYRMDIHADAPVLFVFL